MLEDTGVDNEYRIKRKRKQNMMETESETEQVSLLPRTDPQNPHENKRAKMDHTQNVL